MLKLINEKAVDDKLVDQHIEKMKNIGLFEAKTRLSEICEKVRKEKQPVLITRRGKPLVRIDPLEDTNNGVWDLARKSKRANGPIKDNLELSPRSIHKEKIFLD